MQVRNLSTTVLTLRKHGRKFLLQPGKVTTIPEVLFTKEQVKAIYGNFVQILNDDLKVVDTPSEDAKDTHKEVKIEKVEAPEETTEVVEEVTETPVEEVAEVVEETEVAEEATEEQRRRREQYEQDKSTFEHSVMKKVRGLCEIQEDYIKVLHPLYREKFIEGIRKYGTVAAAMKYMKDNHGLKLRGDVLTRITQILPSFKQEVDDAIGEYQAMLHMEMQRRAVEGIDKNIYDKEGNVVNTEKVYSDSLLSKMVDTYNPEYKEAKATNTNKGNVVNVQIIKDFHNYKE